MTTEDPWEGLAAGGRDARRVDKDGHHDLFWWMSELDEPSLLMKLGANVQEVDPLPRIGQLGMRFAPVYGGRALMIRLKDPDQKDLFATLCRDVVAAAESVADPQDALRRAVTRTKRWHHLLRGGSPDRLGKEEQRGLVGELDLLRLLLERCSARAAVEAWTGPNGAAKDFELGGLCVEVKARRGAARPWVSVSSEDQLADVEGAQVILRVADVDAAVKPRGFTLTDHVKRVDELFKEHDLESYGLWEAALSATGYSHDHDYSGLRWTVGAVHHYEVGEGFPRVVPPLAEGVTDLRYAISLTACAPFEITSETFLTLVDEDHHV